MTSFQETQSFNQKWIWLLLIAMAIFPLYGIIQQVILGNPVGENPGSNTMWIVIGISMLLPLLLFYIMKLHTTIDSEGIKMRFAPFTSKEIPWSAISSTEVLDYGFVGGWGIRIGSKYGTVYNISGSKGVWIKLNNGKKFLIGTQRADELKAFLENRNKA